MYLKVNCNWL